MEEVLNFGVSPLRLNRNQEVKPRFQPYTRQNNISRWVSVTFSIISLGHNFPNQEEKDLGPKTIQKRIAPQRIVNIPPNQTVQPAVVNIRIRPMTIAETRGQAITANHFMDFPPFFKESIPNFV